MTTSVSVLVDFHVGEGRGPAHKMMMSGGGEEKLPDDGPVGTEEQEIADLYESLLLGDDPLLRGGGGHSGGRKSHVEFGGRHVFAPDDSHPPPSPAERPRNSSLRSFDPFDLAICDKGLCAMNSRDFGGDELKFLDEFGISGVMAQRVRAKCASLYNLTVLIDNCPSMARRDSRSVEGTMKRKPEATLPPDKRLAKNEGYVRSLVPCPRHEALTDVSYFLAHLAVTMAVPTSFELFACPKKLGGKGRCFRRIGAKPKCAKKRASRVDDPEDYIPPGEQAESTLEMIENVGRSLAPGPHGHQLKVEESLREFCPNELRNVGREGKRATVLVMTSLRPWGNRVGDDLDRQRFVDLLNSFADLPVTFVFLVETDEEEVVDLYESLASPRGGVAADVRTVTGLGRASDGVGRHNPWMNYCLPLHLCGALGIGPGDVLSAAARRPLRADEVRAFCDAFVGGGGFPDPEAEPDAFLEAVEKRTSGGENSEVWNPAYGYDTPLIETMSLKHHLTKRKNFWGRCVLCMKR